MCSLESTLYTILGAKLSLFFIVLLHMVGKHILFTSSLLNLHYRNIDSKWVVFLQGKYIYICFNAYLNKTRNILYATWYICDIKSHMASSHFTISPSVLASSGRRYLARIKCVLARKLMFLSKSSKEDFVNVPVCKTRVTWIRHVMMYSSVLKSLIAKERKKTNIF